MSLDPLLADAVEQAVFFLLPIVLVAGLVSLLISGIVTIAPAERTFTRLAHAGLAVLLAVDSVLLVLYARGPDTYYTSGVSRWEHADRFVGSTRVAFVIAFAAVTSLLLGATALAPDRQLLRLLVTPAAAISCVFLLLAWFWLTAGH